MSLSEIGLMCERYIELQYPMVPPIPLPDPANGSTMGKRVGEGRGRGDQLANEKERSVTE